MATSVVSIVRCPTNLVDFANQRRLDSSSTLARGLPQVNYHLSQTVYSTTRCVGIECHPLRAVTRRKTGKMPSDTAADGREEEPEEEDEDE